MKTFKQFNESVSAEINGTNHKFMVDPAYDNYRTTLAKIPTHKIESSFKNDTNYYVPKNGEGTKQNKFKYDKFKDFLDTKPDQIEASSLDINSDGHVHFNNGRHRYAVMRDSGVTHIPVSLDKESQINAKKHGYI